MRRFGRFGDGYGGYGSGVFSRPPVPYRISVTSPVPAGTVPYRIPYRIDRIDEQVGSE
jgi:hypothetical protein